MKRLPIKELGLSTFVGAGAIALLLILGLVSNSFLLWLGIAFLIVMLTGLYTLVTGRRSWVHLAGRAVGGIVFAVGAVAWVASWAVFGASLPKQDTASSPRLSPSPTVATSAAVSPSVTATTSAAVSPSATVATSAAVSPSPSNSASPGSLSAAFGQTITFPSGFSVKISYLGRFTPGPLAFGAEDGKIAAFEVTVRNGTNRKINMTFSSIPIFTYGPDHTEATVAGDVTIEGVHPFLFPTLEPGQEATMKDLEGIPEKWLEDVRATMNNPDRFKQNLGDENAPHAIFEGPLQEPAQP